MKFEDLTVQQVKEMSQEDLFVWGDRFAKREQAKQIRKILIDNIEIADSKKVIE